MVRISNIVLWDTTDDLNKRSHQDKTAKHWKDLSFQTTRIYKDLSSNLQGK
jgi:hypothetical protein